MKLSVAYRFLRFIGLHYSESEYGSVTFSDIIRKTLRGYINAFLAKYCYSSVIFSPLNPRKLRPKLWSMMGAKMGKGCFIGPHVTIDANNAELIEIGDHSHITANCLLLCHQRDLSEYYRGDDASKLPYRKGIIKLGKGVMVGMGTIIMPGVEIGDGAIIGANSMVTRNIPAWTVAVGSPAKIVKEIPVRE